MHRFPDVNIQPGGWQKKRSARKAESTLKEYIRWGSPIVIGVLFIIVIIILQNETQRIVARFEKYENPEQRKELLVIVTENDLRYHQPTCPRIRGDEREMTYGEAIERELKPCPYCYPQDTDRGEDESLYNLNR